MTRATSANTVRAYPIRLGMYMRTGHEEELVEFLFRLVGCLLSVAMVREMMIFEHLGSAAPFLLLLYSLIAILE